MYPIPPNATRIRYLESTGTQYVDTGTTVTSGSSYEIRLDYVQTAGVGVIYTYPQDDNADLRFFYNGTGNKLFYDRGSQRLQYSYSKKNGLNIRLGNFWLEESGTTLASGTAQSWSSPSGTTLRVFSNIASSSKYDKIKLYSLKIYDGSTLVRSYVPLRIGSVGYLFDRVSGQLFGNAADNNAGFPAECLGPDTFASGVVPTRMLAMGVRKKEVWPTPRYTGVSLVGSSVQNNGGILSGFTSSSYATMPFFWTAGASQIEAVIKIHFAQDAPGGSGQGIWGCVGSTNAFTPFFYDGPSGPLGSYLSPTGSGSWHASPTGTAGSKRVAWDNSSPLAAGDYILREVYENSTVKTGRWSNGAWTTETSNSFGTIYGASNLVPQLGTNRGQNSPFLGTIDLNYTYLYRDGELWWEGAAGAYRNVKTTYPD